MFQPLAARIEIVTFDSIPFWWFSEPDINCGFPPTWIQLKYHNRTLISSPEPSWNSEWWQSQEREKLDQVEEKGNSNPSKYSNTNVLYWGFTLLHWTWSENKNQWFPLEIFSNGNLLALQITQHFHKDLGIFWSLLARVVFLAALVRVVTTVNLTCRASPEGI